MLREYDSLELVTNHLSAFSLTPGRHFNFQYCDISFHTIFNLQIDGLLNFQLEDATTIFRSSRRGSVLLLFHAQKKATCLVDVLQERQIGCKRLCLSQGTFFRNPAHFKDQWTFRRTVVWPQNQMIQSHARRAQHRGFCRGA